MTMDQHMARDIGLGETDDDLTVLQRRCFTLEALYVNNNSSCSVFIKGDKAGYRTLQDGDPSFRLTVVSYTCGKQNHVVDVMTIYSNVEENKAGGDSVVYVLCADRDMSQEAEIAGVTVESVKLQDELSTVKLKANDRRYFYKKNCRGEKFCLRSTAFDNFYLAVEENISGQKRLCLKRVTSIDLENHSEVQFDSFDSSMIT
jgi:hypothetical protein